jgi:hypothetical protein
VPDAQHLAFIQGVITRLSGNSFLLKGWAVTLVAGLSAFAAADTNEDLAWIAVGVVLIFAVLDAFYLAQERAYRQLYATAAGRTTTDWSLDAPHVGPTAVISALFSLAVLPLYVAGAAGATVVALTA